MGKQMNTLKKGKTSRRVTMREQGQEEMISTITIRRLRNSRIIIKKTNLNIINTIRNIKTAINKKQPSLEIKVKFNTLRLINSKITTTTFTITNNLVVFQKTNNNNNTAKTDTMIRTPRDIIIKMTITIITIKNSQANREEHISSNIRRSSSSTVERLVTGNITRIFTRNRIASNIIVSLIDRCTIANHNNKYMKKRMK